jgi:transposase
VTNNPLLPLTATPPCDQPACRQALWDARNRVRFYQAMHQRSTLREAKLKQQLTQQQVDCAVRLRQRDAEHQQHVADLQAEIRLLKQRLYGRSGESHHHPNTLAHPEAATAEDADPAAPTADSTQTATSARRPRGQQRGRPSHGRRRYHHLPAQHETAELPPEQCCCTTCGLPFARCGSEPEPTTLLEVTVRAHRRVIRRRRYRPTCVCGTHPARIVAPVAGQLIPKSPLGISIWVQVLLDKYASHRPTYRLLQQWRHSGLDLAQGTITDGLQRLLPLLEPVDAAWRTHLRQQRHWHGDETRWQVFATVEGKVGYCWYLWLVQSAEVAVFELAMGRAHDVPEGLLGAEACGIFNADRYAAYPAMQQVQNGQIILALCWAHQRRDFIEVERGHPELHAWASQWLERIANLYRLNAARLQVWQKDEAAFATAQQQLQAAVDALAAAGVAEEAQAEWPAACRKVLAGLRGSWAGLTVFVTHPEVPMDNNTAERAERGPVVGRKNYYGSGAVWAGRLAAMMFSLLETLRLWQLNPQRWLTSYLTACAANGGKAVPALRQWLPWQMTASERAELSGAGATAVPVAADSS